jgi:hypothetical protein
LGKQKKDKKKTYIKKNLLQWISHAF